MTVYNGKRKTEVKILENASEIQEEGSVYKTNQKFIFNQVWGK